jgi:hypothetical protein
MTGTSPLESQRICLIQPEGTVACEATEVFICY